MTEVKIQEQEKKSVGVKGVEKSTPQLPYPFRIGSHIVVLNQVEQFSILPKEEAIRGEVIKRIGSQFKYGTHDIIRGLSVEEEERFLPNIIGIQPNSENWDQAVKAYWADYTINVTTTGLELEIGFKEDGKTPLNLKHYMDYKFCVENSNVAVTDEELDNKDIKSFFIIDYSKLQDEKLAKNRLLKEADKEFVLLTSDDTSESRTKVTHILTVLSGYGDTMGLSYEMREMKLRELKEENPQRFLEVVKDKNIADHALLQKALSVGEVTLEGETYFLQDMRMGSGKREAIGWLQDNNNSSIRSKLVEKLKAITI